MMLKEKLTEMGIDSGSDKAITVIDRGCTMAVSRRYLEGGWQEVLDSELKDFNKESMTFII